MSALEVNKIVAAFLVAAMTASMSGFLSTLLYGDSGHDEHAEHAYSIGGMGTLEERAKAPSQPEEVPLAARLADADPEAGADVTKKCASCHTFEMGGPHKIGPNLWGVVNRPVASAEGFAYSSALEERSDEAWTYASLDAFLADPKDWAPGTKMSFAGIKKDDQRADLIAHLRELSDSPAPLPAAGAAEQAAARPEKPEEKAETPAETAETAEAAAEGAAGGLGPMVAAASAEAGEKVSRKCRSCHTFDEGGADRIGPNLYGVLGRPVAGKEGYSYSSALQAKSGETWSYAALDAFLTNPKDWAPGTKMGFAGLKEAEDRAALLAYLREMNDSPPPLPD
jgi:cytochrome c